MVNLRVLMPITIGFAAILPVSANREQTQTFTARLERSSTDDKGKKTAQPTIVARVVSAGADARADVIEGGKDLERGNVILANDGGRVLFVIDERRREYREMSPATFEHEAAAVGKAFKLEVARSDVQVSELGSGERIAGAPTRRYRITRSLEGTVQVMFIKERLTFDETIELWFSDGFGEMPNPLAGLLLSGTGMLPALHADTREKYAAAQRELPGLNPVRIVYAATETTGKGTTKRTEATVTIDEPRQDNQRAPSFDLPSGLKRKNK